MDERSARPLMDWSNDHGLDKRTTTLVILRALQAAIEVNKRKIEYLEKQIVSIEEEMTAIEDASGVELPEDAPKGIHAYVKASE